MQELAKKYIKKHFDFGEMIPSSESTGSNKKKDGLPPLSLSFKIFLFSLKGLPYLCLLAFAISFAWDPGLGVKINFLGVELLFDRLMRTVAISGLIGYSTNLLAIKMLFKPVKKRPIWGQGLIPAQRTRIIAQLAKGMDKHILSKELIKKRIHESGIISRLNQKVIHSSEALLRDKDFQSEIKTYLYDALSEYLSREEIKEKFSSTINVKLEEKVQGGLKGFLFNSYKKLNKKDYDLVLNNLIESLPQVAMDVLGMLENEIEELGARMASKEKDIEEFLTLKVIEVLEKIDILELLKKQMEHFNESKLEEMVWNATSEQLVYIQLLGTLLGIFGGLLIWQPEVMLAIYLAILSALFFLDIAIFKLAKRKN